MTTAAKGAPLSSVPGARPDADVEVTLVADGLEKDRFV